MPHQIAAPTRRQPVLIAIGATAVGALFLGAVALWFHYGTAVFFEMIAAGFSACF